jgi:hypothetical protein
MDQEAASDTNMSNQITIFRPFHAVRKMASLGNGRPEMQKGYGFFEKMTISVRDRTLQAKCRERSDIADTERNE